MLPPTIRITRNAGEAEKNATSYLSVYAVGANPIEWSIKIWNNTCDSDDQFVMLTKGRPYGYIGNRNIETFLTTAGAAGANRAEAHEGVGWMTLGSEFHPWTTGLEPPTRQNKTTIPGNGQADPVNLAFDAYSVLGVAQRVDRNAESPVVKGCITVKVKEQEEKEYFQVWVEVELTVKIPCAAGTYSPQDGTTPCLICATNTYQDEAGQRSCKTCR